MRDCINSTLADDTHKTCIPLECSCPKCIICAAADGTNHLEFGSVLRAPKSKRLGANLRRHVVTYLIIFCFWLALFDLTCAELHIAQTSTL